MYDLIIVGAGPAGLSASYHAKEKGLNYICLEADKLVSTLKNYPIKKTLFAFGKGLEIGNIEFKPANGEKVYREEVLEYYEAIAKNNDLNIKLGEKVIYIKGENDYLIVTSIKEKYQGKQVILATGMQSCPRHLNVSGEDLDKVHHALKDPALYKDKNALVVGGGNTAIEAALALNENGAKVTMSYRKEAFFRLSEHNTEEIKQKEENEEIKIIYNSAIVVVNEKDVVIQTDLKEEVLLSNDVVFVLIGSEPSKAFLEKLGLKMDGVKPVYNPETKESNIKYLFIAGDLTKETLINNAIRHGKEIVERLK